MDADSRKAKLLNQLDEFMKTEILDAYNSGYQDGERVGFDAGRLAGIEEGRASAAALIAGLRSLLGMVEGGELPAELAPAGVTFRPLRASDLSNPIIDEAIETTSGVGSAQNILEVLNEVVEDHDQKLKREAERSDQLLEDNPGVNFPGYYPLDAPVGDCQLCQGFGTIEGELYGQPVILPCTCKAGELVKADAERELSGANTNTFSIDPDGDLPRATVEAQGMPEVAEPAATKEPGQAEEDEPESICFRMNCRNHDAGSVNGCSQLEHVFECPHWLKGAAVVCANLGCGSFESGKPANCAAIADMMESQGIRKPATGCNRWMPAPALAGTKTFDPELAGGQVEEGRASVSSEGGDFLCCSTCNIADPDCASCNLIEQEINERNEAERIARESKATSALDPAKCVNKNCTAIHPLPGKAPDTCLIIQGKECKSFVELEEQEAAPKAFSQPAAVVGQGATEMSPEAARLLELQKTCKHPKVFIAVIPGRGEVCQCCDLVLTPESLPLFQETSHQVVDAATYFGAAAEVGPECDHFPESVRFNEGGKTYCGKCGEEVVGAAPRPECKHPLDFRHRTPDAATGGAVITCGECGEVVNRVDANRKSIPRDQWPEYKEAGKVVTIATGTETREVSFSLAERKMLAAGFTLACFVRPDKENIRLWVTTGDKWLLVGKYRKFVDGERALDELLKDEKTVQVSESGNAATSRDEAKLRAVGFNFYRKEKGSEGVSPKIKDGSKNWGMHSKYRSDAELDIAWQKLLIEDQFALEG